MEKYVRIYSLDDATDDEKVCACYPKPMKNVSGNKYEETMIKAEQDAKEGKCKLLVWRKIANEEELDEAKLSKADVEQIIVKYYNAKEYMKDNRRFADLFNYYVYDGEQVIQPENLQPRDTSEIVSIRKADGTFFSKQDFRDVLKDCIIMSDGSIDYLLLGVENQSSVHYAMPVKNLVYDALNYSAQVTETAKQHRKDKDAKGAEFLSGFKKEDRLIPVITLTLLWDSCEWDGPTSLQEMYATQDKRLLKYLANTPINLVAPGDIQDFEKFRSELGPVLELIAKKNDSNGLDELLRRNKEWYSHVDLESVKVLNACLNTKFESENSEEEGGVNMCKASIVYTSI